MSFFKSLKKAIGIAAPLAGLLPGVGLPLAVGLGAAGGALSGGGLRGALTGGLGAAALGGGGPLLGSALGAGAGTGAAALGTGLLGAGAGGAAGGLKGALLGGGAGALGGYAGAGGFDGFSNSLGLTGENSIFGTAAGSPLGNGAQGATQGSGILGAAGRGFSDLSSALSTGGGGGSSAYGSNAGSGSSYAGLGSLIGGLNSLNANDNAESDLLDSQRQALSRYQPYVDAKFEPGDLTQDPGYQFRLKQGEEALGRQQASKGSLFSGAALKAAQDYGQGLADTTYNEAYNRWLEQNQQNIGVADRTSGLDLEGGNVRANAGISNSNVLNRGLSSLLGGYGAYSNTGAPLGQQGWLYDPRTGQRLNA